MKPSYFGDVTQNALLLLTAPDSSWGCSVNDGITATLHLCCPFSCRPTPSDVIGTFWPSVSVNSCRTERRRPFCLAAGAAGDGWSAALFLGDVSRIISATDNRAALWRSWRPSMPWLLWVYTPQKENKRSGTLSKEAEISRRSGKKSMMKEKENKCHRCDEMIRPSCPVQALPLEAFWSRRCFIKHLKTEREAAGVILVYSAPMPPWQSGVLFINQRDRRIWFEKRHRNSASRVDEIQQLWFMSVSFSSCKQKEAVSICPEGFRQPPAPQHPALKEITNRTLKTNMYDPWSPTVRIYVLYEYRLV